MADIFGEYNLAYRLGSRTPRPGGETYADEARIFRGRPDGSDAREGVCAGRNRAARCVAGHLRHARSIRRVGSSGAVGPLKQKSKTSAFLSDFRDLAVGDYVVHVEHGIGQYHGLREIEQGDGGKVEFMMLEYAEGARLYVPLTRLDLVQKYRSPEGAKPVLDRLGTQQWAKTKARVKKAMKDMADELLKLYALRKTGAGPLVSAGHGMAARIRRRVRVQRDRRSGGGHHRHQARHGIDAADGSPAVRRRGLRQDGSGDARRLQGRERQQQVAVLAPTTVLAFQHFETFKRRFAAFPDHASR